MVPVRVAVGLAGTSRLASGGPGKQEPLSARAGDRRASEGCGALRVLAQRAGPGGHLGCGRKFSSETGRGEVVAALGLVARSWFGYGVEKRGNWRLRKLATAGGHGHSPPGRRPDTVLPQHLSRPPLLVTPGAGRRRSSYPFSSDYAGGAARGCGVGAGVVRPYAVCVANGARAGARGGGAAGAGELEPRSPGSQRPEPAPPEAD